MKLHSLSLASGQAGKRASGLNSLFVALMVSALSLVSWEQEAQAQLYLDIFPSQDNTNQTLWVFSGSSTTSGINDIRTSSSSNELSERDSWYFVSPNNGNIFATNGPAKSNISLSPLLSSSNSKDIASVNARIPGGGKTNITFAANATNTPTITIGSGSRTISHLYMFDDSSLDEMGIRISGSSSFSYSASQSSAWTGAGILNKPIGDFFAGTYHNYTESSHLAASSSGSIQVRINSAFIPEPQEYALVFGLFALGFVFFHRHRQKKRQQAQTTTTY